ncbi:MAG: alpha-mannosidase [Anaerolineaceae bacterium]|nr:alpha-mannosidase [Anaerolineaceae bacterium]
MQKLVIAKIERHLRDVRQAIVREALDIPRFKMHAGDCPGAEAPDFDDAAWAGFSVGETWGGYDQVAWFRARVAVPPAWQRDAGRVAVRFLVGPRDGGLSTAETQLYVDGERLQAIDYWHEEAWLPPELLARGELTVALRAWSGIYGVPDRRRFRLAQLVRIDPATERFYHLADTVLRVACLQDENDPRRVALLEALDDAWRCLDLFQGPSPAFYASVPRAHAVLASAMEAAGGPEIRPTVAAVGHSHIDMAWMWRLHHTREKATRTFSTMLHLMRQYPEFRFSHSSPQLYQFVREDAPEIYARIKERVAEGRWEVLGGSWVEFDTNLPGGEALVRQILLGKEFARREFGLDPTVLWLPDSFGFSWVLPQLMRRSGIKYFATAAIGRSAFGQFPYDVFRWRGMDGSEVLAHLITTSDEPGGRYTYIGDLSPEQVLANWRNYRQKELSDETLMTYGWGDGGGGPMPAMLEAARAQECLPGHPAVRLDTVEGFFRRLERRVDPRGASLPVWDGELYQESARGAYTSQSRNKRANRRAEALYHDAEWLCALADVLRGEDRYPHAALRRGWERLLLLQFHDILPGTSIHDVHEDSLADYAWVAGVGARARREAQNRLLAGIRTDGESVVVFNPLAWPRRDVVSLPCPPGSALAGKHILDDDGTPLPSQVVREGARTRLLLETPEIPPLGYRALPLVQGDTCPARECQGTPRAENELAVAPDRLENAFYRIALDGKGHIVSLFDKRAGREVLLHPLTPDARAGHRVGIRTGAPQDGVAPGTVANALQAFEDRPVLGDAWELDPHYREKMRPVDELLEAVVEESGPVRGTLRLAWRLAGSTITQRLTIYRRSPRIDFRTELDWHEHQVLLKAAFPAQIRATFATYEIQFGSIERPTHWNTPGDAAHFENPAQRWVDLSEGNYGLALLNDCKHGYDVKDNVLRLTLHRSPTDPDPQADQGRHLLTYSLLPHAGTWREGGVVRQAQALNHPLRAALVPAQPDGPLPPAFALASVDAEHVVLDTVKRAEDGDGWIVRLYEAWQYSGEDVTVTFGRPLRRAVECNLMEEEIGEVRVDGPHLAFAIAPCEIRTFRVWLA